MRIRFAILLLLCLAPAGAEDYVRHSAPELFTYGELVTLSEDKEFEPGLAAKLQVITTSPFLSNEAYYLGAEPHAPEIDDLGRSLNMVFWNIERGVHLEEIKLLFTDKKAFLDSVAEDGRAKPADIGRLGADIATRQRHTTPDSAFAPTYQIPR